MEGPTRDVFLLHQLEQLDYRQIAVRLGISVEDVERHLAAAMLQLDRASDGE